MATAPVSHEGHLHWSRFCVQSSTRATGQQTTTQTGPSTLNHPLEMADTIPEDMDMLVDTSDIP